MGVRVKLILMVGVNAWIVSVVFAVGVVGCVFFEIQIRFDPGCGVRDDRSAKPRLRIAREPREKSLP